MTAHLLVLLAIVVLALAVVVVIVLAVVWLTQRRPGTRVLSERDAPGPPRD